MKLIVPAYGIKVAKGSLGENTLVILNPNSGPGLTRDKAWAPLGGRDDVAGYIDLKVYAEDRTLFVPKGREWRWRTVEEVRSEVAQWKKWFGVSRIFFDDYDPRDTPRSLVSEVNSLGDDTIINPGWDIRTPEGYKGYIISHEKKGMPSVSGDLSRRGAIALKCQENDLPLFLEKCRGLAYVCAYPQADLWRKQKSAYTSINPHLGRLRELCREANQNQPRSEAHNP